MSDLESKNVSVTGSTINVSIDEFFGAQTQEELLTITQLSSEAGKLLTEVTSEPNKFPKDVEFAFGCDYEEALNFTSYAEYYFFLEDTVYFEIVFYGEQDEELDRISEIVEYNDTKFEPYFNFKSRRKEESDPEPGVGGIHLEIHISTSREQADLIEHKFRQHDENFHKVRFTVGRPVVEV